MSIFSGWILLAFFTAAAFGAVGLVGSHLASRGVDERTLAWGTWAFALPWFLPPLAARPVPDVSPAFWPVLALGLAGGLVAYTLFFRALGRTDASLAMPLVSLTPVFMLGTSFLLLGERPGTVQAAGVVVATAGVYVLGASAPAAGRWSARHLLEPVRALSRDAGARDALAVGLVWSVTANLDKACTLASSPPFYSLAYGLGFVLLYPVAVGRPRPGGRLGGLALVGALHAAMALAQFAALERTNAAYVVAVKRAGALLPLAAGALLGERIGPARALGAVLTVLGVAIVATG